MHTKLLLVPAWHGMEGYSVYITYIQLHTQKFYDLSSDEVAADGE